MKGKSNQLDELFDIESNPDWCFLRSNFWEHLARKFIMFDERNEAYLCSHRVIRENDDYGPEIIANDLRCYWKYKGSWCNSEKITVDEKATWEDICDDHIWGISEMYSENLFSYCVIVRDSSEDLSYEIQARVFVDGLNKLRKFTVTAANGVDEEAAKAISSWFVEK